jgi:hypothetical protein
MISYRLSAGLPPQFGAFWEQRAAGAKSVEPLAHGGTVPRPVRAAPR